MTWTSDDMPQMPRPGPVGVLRAALRGGVIVGMIALGLGVLLVLRAIEALFVGARRPLSPWVTRSVCRASVAVLGIGLQVQGQPMRHPGAVVANHSSWLDIFLMNAGQVVFFVSKDDVARWPVIGWVARAAGTLFIKRDRREAAAQKALFDRRLRAGHRLLFFPEGTSTDGRRVLGFKPTLFAAFFDPELRDQLWVQPVTAIYHAPEGADPRLYGWWGDMAFGAHLLHTLSAPRQGRVELVYHPPLRVADFAHRRDLAAQAEQQVRAALTEALPAPEGA